MKPFYGERKFLDRSKISKHLECTICFEIFTNPTRLDCSYKIQFIYYKSHLLQRMHKLG